MATKTSTPTKPPILGTVTVEDPGDAPLTSATAAFAYAEKLVIKSDEDYTSAAADLADMKGKAVALEAGRKKRKAPLDRLVAKFQARYRKASELFEQAEEIVKTKINAYQKEQKTKRLAAQAKADEDARNERAKLQQRANRALAAGKTEKADALQATAAMVVPTIIATEPPKVAGLSTREVWDAECTDILDLARAVVEGNAPAAYIQANKKVLRAQARSLKDQFVCPGVRVWPTDSLSSSASTTELPS